jgi:uncharacterized membrane protein
MSQVETGQFGYPGMSSGTEHEEHEKAPEGFGPTQSPQQNVGNTERIVSAAAGAGLAAFGLKRGGLSGLALGAIGAGLLWRGWTGRCQCYAALGINTVEGHNSAVGVPAQHGCKVEKTITVSRPASELYQFWRRLENLPKVMRHLKNVEQIDHERSHWVAEGAFGKDVEWDAEIHNERENELIAWRSLPGGDIDTAGSVRFKPIGNNGRTEVTLSMKYNPPAGKLGAQLASLFGEGLEGKLDEDLCRFKQVMETGMEPAPSDAPTAGAGHFT